MPSILFALMTPLFAAEPAAASGPRPVVIWTEPALPSEEDRRRVEKTTGAADHASWPEVAFEAKPFGDADTKALEGLKSATSSARSRWDQFDVEAKLAAELNTAAEGIAVVRDESDRSALVDALLLEGAAALRVVPESKWDLSEEVAPWRRKVVTSSAPSALVDVLALEPDHNWLRSEVPDAATLLRMQALQTEVRAAPRATLSLAPVPAGTLVLVDGRTVASGAKSVDLQVGHHYVHASLDGKLLGRREFDVAPGAAESFGPIVSVEVLAKARSQVIAGLSEMPGDLARTGVPLAGGTPRPIYVAAIDDKGNPRVVAWKNGAVVNHRSPVTFMLAAAIGGGIIVSPDFSIVPKESVTALAFGGDLGFELGIFNAAIFGGTTLDVTPGEQMRYANADLTENIRTNDYFRPYGGIGVYLPRPKKGTPLLMLGGNYGWMSPGSMGFGARLSVGVPATDDGTWLRFMLDGYRGVEMAGFPDEGLVTYGAALRLGFGRLL